MKADFMLIGVQKCGTTSLAHQLAQHRGIGFCTQKEPDYFTRNPDWKANLADYHSLYEQKPGLIYGEASTSYSWLLEFPDTADKLYEYNPDLRLIYLIRNPVDRVESHFNHHYLKGRVKQDIDREIFDFPTYISHSRYAIQIRPFLERFPKENIKVIIFEEYSKDPLRILKELAGFLNVDPQEFDQIDLTPQYQSDSRVKVRNIKNRIAPFVRFLPLALRDRLRKPFIYKPDSRPKMDAALRKKVWRHVEDDVNAIEELFNLNLAAWKAEWK